MTSRRRLLGTAAALAPLSGLFACKAPSPPETSQPVTYTAPGGIGAILLSAPIFPRTRDLLRRNIDGLLAAGATTIRLGINSPGGDTDAARAIVADMNGATATRQVVFETFAVGTVASAATYVFLNGQRRFAQANGSFLFHAAGLFSTGVVSAERLREEAAKIEDYERQVRALLKSRTRLTDAAIDVYLHRTVILNADDARRDGVVEAIAPFTVPPGAKVVVIAARRAQPDGTAAAPPSQPNGR